MDDLSRLTSGLPRVVRIKNYKYHWFYKNELGSDCALVVRHDEICDNGDIKKWFHQYQMENGEWIEGAATPSPLFGIESLPKPDSTQNLQKVYIFEGEKCTKAAHNLGLAAITSMMGSNAVHKASWHALKRFPKTNHFVLIPDNDEAGNKFIESVWQEIKKNCPDSVLEVCLLPCANKGEDFVDWVKREENCPKEWDEFGSFPDHCVPVLRKAFEDYVSQNSICADEFFRVLKKSKITAFSSSPEPLEAILYPVEECPIHTLPKVIVAWMTAISQQMQVPVDYLAAPFLVVTGSLIGRKRGLMLRPGSDWYEYPNLWGITIGRPSVMKSPAMNAVLKPLLRLAENAHAKFEEEQKQYEKEEVIWQMAEKVTLEGMKGSMKNKMGNSFDLSKSFKVEEYVNFQLSESRKEPKKKRYLTQDATVEKLGEILRDTPQGLLQQRDELAGWLYGLQKTGRENERQFYLEGWSGKQSFDVDRIGRGSVHIPAICLSILGTIQPGPFSSYIRDAVKEGIGDDGFIQRFQVIVWPDQQPEWKLVLTEDISALEKPVNEIFDVLNHLEFEVEGNPVYLHFNAEAQQLFDFWQAEHEKRLRQGTLSPCLEAHLAKYKKLLPGLCLILEHLHSAECMRHPQEISAETLKSAVIWLKYFEAHARRTYASGGTVIPKVASELLGKIRAGEVKEPFTARDVYYGHHWSGLSTREDVDEVLDYLVEKNYLFPQNESAVIGRPTIRFYVHPEVMEKNK